MKPFRSILPLLLTTPALVPLVGAVASNPRSAAPDLSTLPAATALSASDPALLPLPSDRLAVPASRQANETLLALEPSAASRVSRSLTAPPPLTSPTVVRLGDTLVKIAQRYGLTLGELLQLNPGLQTANLVVGSQVEVVRSAPGRSRMLLGLAPVGSGGLSWPELPRFGGEQRPGGYQRGSLALVWPAQGTFTSGYGWRWGRMHRGIDIANNVGTPILAVARGQVTFAGWHDGGYGYLVEITHDDGSLTRYGHNSALLVREGDQVQQGQVISQMGSTGRSTGPHLHFELHPPGQGASNPLAFLPPRA